MNDLQEYEAQQGNALAEAESSRAVAEIQSQMAIAKRFPRSPSAACNRIVEACKRHRLAEAAIYTYPRGGTKVEGPSIRLAEALAQNWGNISYGIDEIEQRDGSSLVKAYCHDLETNTYRCLKFVVSHERHTRNGVTKLTDPRDIYEMVANQGARRLRACILGVIPADVVDEAVEQCNLTLQGNSGEPIADRIKRMIKAFQEWGVTVEMLEERLGHSIDSTTDFELADMRKIATSLRDKMSKREDWFGVRVEAGSKVGKSTVMDDLDAETQAGEDVPFTVPADEPSGMTPYEKWKAALDDCQTQTQANDCLKDGLEWADGEMAQRMKNAADIRKGEIRNSRGGGSQKSFT